MNILDHVFVSQNKHTIAKLIREKDTEKTLGCAKGDYFKCEKCGMFIYEIEDGYAVSVLSNPDIGAKNRQMLTCAEFTVWEIIK